MGVSSYPGIVVAAVIAGLGITYVETSSEDKDVLTFLRDHSGALWMAAATVLVGVGGLIAGSPIAVRQSRDAKGT